MARSHPPRSWWALSCLPVVLVLLCYRTTLDHPFVYDDYRTVLENASLKQPVDWNAVLHFDRFRPVVSLTYLADFLRGGKEPTAFHVTNVGLHAANSLFVFWLVVALLSDLNRRGLLSGAMPVGENKQERAKRADQQRSSEKVRWAVAVVVSSIFAVHPLMTESVTYVTGRSESVCALFFLSALLVFRQDALHSSSAGPRSLIWRAAWLLLWIAALASKEVAAAFPFVALAWDRLLLAAPKERRRLLSVHVPLIVLTAVAGSIRITGLVLQEVNMLQRPVLENLYSQATVVWRYLGLLLWPQGQSLVHPVAHRTVPWEPATILAVVGFFLATWLAWRVRTSRPWWLLALVWFAFCIAPSSSFIPLTELMAEHRAYLASIGVLLAVGAELARGLVYRGPSRHGQRWAAAAGAVLVLLLAALTTHRNEVWADPIDLWSNAVERSERSAATHLGLGTALQRVGRCKEAIPVYRRSVELEPTFPGTHINLGVCLAQTEQFEAAYATFRRVVELDPGHVRTYNNLAKLELMRGRVEEARSWLNLGLGVDQSNVLARMSLAHIHERYDLDPSSALTLCHEVRSLAPETPGVEECIARLAGVATVGGAP